MPTTNKYISHPGTFDPKAISVMGAAYENALASFPISAPESVREVIATNIIGASREGERDRDKLCEVALKTLQIEGLNE